MAKKRKAPDDLSELDEIIRLQEEGLLVQIMHMDGVTPLGFGIYVAGPDSERAVEARRQMSIEAADRESLEPLTPEERFIQATKYLSRISIRFWGRAKLDGRVLSDSEDDFFALYKRFRFIREQVDRGAASREGFLIASEKNSGAVSETESAETSGS